MRVQEAMSVEDDVRGREETTGEVRGCWLDGCSFSMETMMNDQSLIAKEDWKGKVRKEEILCLLILSVAIPQTDVNHYGLGPSMRRISLRAFTMKSLYAAPRVPGGRKSSGLVSIVSRRSPS